MASEVQRVTCICNNCSQHLEFEVSNAGQTVQCPHCEMETVLYIPNAPVGILSPPTPAQPPVIPKIEPLPPHSRSRPKGRNITIREIAKYVVLGWTVLSAIGATLGFLN